jgi:hypothetical protein
LVGVVTIDLSENRLSDNIHSSIKNCKSLEELFMTSNILSGPISKTLGQVKGIDALDLTSNQQWRKLSCKRKETSASKRKEPVCFLLKRR